MPARPPGQKRRDDTCQSLLQHQLAEQYQLHHFGPVAL